ncbi:MAG: HAMP domain-containing protein [Ignavibacteria bacterium]|jgi:methyl-accepting chemotaxis protein|nr:HAMP domain-containing protein [Ignavibacteria bacterium]MCU7522294.1 HAMP domain-containing protein [Ignavibacteria bacterium]
MSIKKMFFGIYIVTGLAILGLGVANSMMLQNTMYGIIGFLIFSQTVNYLLIHKKISDPVGKLSLATRRVIDGDLSVTVDYKSNDEIGHLSEGFNTMIGKINDEIAMAQSFQQGLSAAMFIADKNTKVLSVNNATLKMIRLNKKPEEIIGKLTVKEAFIQESVSINAFQGKFLNEEKHYIKDHEGNTFPALITSGPIYNSKKEMVACFANFIDLRDLEAKQREYLNEQVAPIADVIGLVAHGDFTKNLELDEKSDLYKLSVNINKMVGDLQNTLSMVSEAVQATASAANEISSSSEQMAAGAQEQSQQATEVAGAIEEMTKTVYETAKNANEAANVSRGSSQAAEQGAKKINDTKKGIEKIVVSSEETSRIVASLSKRSEQIGEITQVIDDIADQTNLLALNAAIEAARAGEQGRGFAVVADEVRKLAERTTKATKEIAETIKAIQDEAKDADSSMGEARIAVEAGMKLTEEVAEVLSEILKGALKTTDVVLQVAAASEEQSSAAEQISKNIEGISSVTQQSAAGTEQIARAAEDLNRLTVNLQEIVAGFKINSGNERQSSNGFVAKNNSKLIKK